MSELEAVRRLRAEAIDDYGPGFKHDYRWTVALNMFERGGQDFRLAGPINIGFTEPAGVALASSRSTVLALIYGVDVIPDPMDLVALGLSMHSAFEPSCCLQMAKHSSTNESSDCRRARAIAQRPQAAFD